MSEEELYEQYLREMYEAEMAGQFDEPEAAPPQEPRDESESEAALQGFGKGATFGYLPELQAGVYQAGEEIANLFGADLPDESFEESVKAFEGRQKRLEEESPTISKIAEVAGGMSIPVPGMAGAKGATALGRIGRAALGGAVSGGLTGALQKTDEKTARLTDDPMANLQQRLINAGYGAGFGGIAGGGLTSIGEGIKKIAPTVGRATSGVTKDAIKTYAKRADEVNALAGDETKVIDMAEEATQKIKNKFFEKKAEIGKRIGEKLDESGKSIWTDDLFEPLYTKLDELKMSARGQTEAGQNEIQALQEFIESNRVGLPNEIDPRTAFELQDVFKGIGDVRNIKGTFASRFPKNADAVEKAISNAGLKAYQKTNKLLEEAAETAGVKAEYKTMAGLQKQLDKYFKDWEATFKTLSGIKAPQKIGARATVKNLGKQVGNLGLKEDAELLEAYRFFQDPELLPISSGGTTSTSRTMSLAGGLEALGAAAGPKGAAFMRGLGTLAGGPMAVKGIIDTSRKVGPYMGPLKDRAVRSGAQVLNPWLQMKKEELLP